MKSFSFIEFSKKMSDFGISLKNLGKGFLNVFVVISILFLWFLIFTFYEPYQTIAIFMIKIIQMGVILVVIGYLMHYLFYFVEELIVKNKIKKYTKK